MSDVNIILAVLHGAAVFKKRKKPRARLKKEPEFSLYSCHGVSGRYDFL